MQLATRARRETCSRVVAVAGVVASRHMSLLAERDDDRETCGSVADADAVARHAGLTERARIETCTRGYPVVARHTVPICVRIPPIATVFGNGHAILR